MKPKTLPLNLKAFEFGYQFDLTQDDPGVVLEESVDKKVILEVEE